MSVVGRAARRMPDPLRPVARHCFYLLHPGVSWRKRRRVDRATAAFVDRFFDDRSTYEAYREAFFGGRIGPLCTAADEALPADRSVYDAHRDLCAKLYALVRERRPATVVETGVYHGVSTVSLLLALAANDRGRLVSLAPSPCLDGDDEEQFRRERPSCAEPGTHRLPDDREPGWILPDDLRERWTMRPGLPTRRLPGLLDEVGDVDLFLHDSGHDALAMHAEFVLAWEHLAPGGVLVSPHVGWNDVFESFVAGRDCESGPVSFEYNGLEDYDAPCRCRYAVRPGGANR